MLLSTLSTAQQAHPLTLEPEGAVQGVHDPVIFKQDDTYYLFGTGHTNPGMAIRCSEDLVRWEFCGGVFFGLPRWTREEVPAVTNLWAPDISYFNGRYHLYYSVSSFGSNHSAIGLATNATLDPERLDYAWIDQGPVIQSRSGDDWNAIDPNLILDEGGQPWLAFGSYWSGIKLRKIDPATGGLSSEDETLYALAGRPRGPGLPGAVEAPFIIKRDGYYYLFVSFDACCRGVESTYNIRVGRSKELTGPYLDRDGTSMLAGGGTLVLAGSERWRGPGHNAILQEDSVERLVYHAYDAESGGAPKLRIETLLWDEQGWPLAPSATP